MRPAGETVLAGLAVLVAVALIFAPSWRRFARSLTAERTERIRSQERADVGAHLHDSVLQTLALIQRSAEDPKQVAALARRQERELRGWLADGDSREPGERLAAALQAAAAEVEAAVGGSRRGRRGRRLRRSMNGRRRSSSRGARGDAQRREVRSGGRRSPSTSRSPSDARPGVRARPRRGLRPGGCCRRTGAGVRESIVGRMRPRRRQGRGARLAGRGHRGRDRNRSGGPAMSGTGARGL